MSLKTWFDGAVRALSPAPVERKLQATAKAVATTATGWLPGPVKTGLHVVNDAFAQPALHSLQPQRGEPPLPVGSQGVRYERAGGTLGAQRISAKGVDQGVLGDCSFESSLAAVAQTHPQLLERSIRQNPNGTYTVTFYRPQAEAALQHLGVAGNLIGGAVLPHLDRWGLFTGSTPVQVTVDGKLPEAAGGPGGVGGAPFAHDARRQLWGPIYEKAYAQYWGGYGAIDHGGLAPTPLSLLTGAPVTHTALGGQNPDQIYAQVAASAKAGHPMVATTFGSASTVPGLVSYHCYSLLGATEQGGQKYVILRNPWGSGTAGKDLGNGTFELPVQQFVDGFQFYDAAQVP